MDAWILITIAAALAQTFRFMLQKQLKTAGLSTGGATFARFIYSAPLVAVLILVYANLSAQPIPSMPGRFWIFALTGGLTQILATMCVVAIFSMRNFAVGITFKKTEVVMTAVAGFAFWGKVLQLPGLLPLVSVCWACCCCPTHREGPGTFSTVFSTRRRGSGFCRACSLRCPAVGYRGASLALSDGDTALRAGVTWRWLRRHRR